MEFKVHYVCVPTITAFNSLFVKKFKFSGKMQLYPKNVAYFINFLFITSHPIPSTPPLLPTPTTCPFRSARARISDAEPRRGSGARPQNVPNNNCFQFTALNKIPQLRYF
jgi:hypothetical protein